MQIPELPIQLLNTLGLGVLATGLVIYYKALVSRSDTLKDSLSDLKIAHESVVAAMDKRAKQIDDRFEDEKKFQNLHLSLLEEVDVFQIRIKTWRDDEVSRLHDRLGEMANRMETLEGEYKRLKIENTTLLLQSLTFKAHARF